MSARFPCFGSTCAIDALGADPAAVAGARRALAAWHARFTRFEPGSELSRLNAAPAAGVPVSATMARFVRAARDAAQATGGLVDPTLLRPLEELGYRGDLRQPLPLPLALRLAPARRPAAPDPAARWRAIAVDAERGLVHRPPGLGLDGGGIVKGMAADALGADLAAADAYVVSCAGDVRVGGAAGLPRPVRVASPFDGSIAHTFELADGGVATSGIGRRSWLGAGGRPAHHLLDPATGRPAFTGVVQATAVAPTALEAEIRAKAALLSGPDGARRWLSGGGALVLDDGGHVVVDPAPLSAGSQPTPSPLPVARRTLHA
jgi:thiamine biosynthesis lipoprotein